MYVPINNSAHTQHTHGTARHDTLVWCERSGLCKLFLLGPGNPAGKIHSTRARIEDRRCARTTKAGLQQSVEQPLGQVWQGIQRELLKLWVRSALSAPPNSYSQRWSARCEGVCPAVACGVEWTRTRIAAKALRRWNGRGQSGGPAPDGRRRPDGAGNAAPRRRPAHCAARLVARRS